MKSSASTDRSDPIVYDWQSTPGLWMAMRANYCGCGDCSRGMHGFGRTKEEAEADLLDMEDAAESSATVESIPK
jgi:hypothetical protein